MGKGNFISRLTRRGRPGLMRLSVMVVILSLAGAAGAQTLDVTPDEDAVFRFSGFEGGSFAPETLTTWTIDDLDNAGLEYTVTTDQPWLRVIPQSGKIISIGTDTANASLVSSEAENLAPGIYTAIVTFRNLTSAQDDITRFVELTVKPSNFTVSPSVVTVTADEGTHATTSTVITLTNHGQQALNYNLTGIPPNWLKVSKSGGTVPGGGQDTFMLTYSTSALEQGAYTAEINVVNTTNGRGTTRILVSLLITDPDDGPILTISPIAAGGKIRVQPNGTILASNDRVIRMLFEEGQIITLSVDVEDGYEFIEWSGDLPIQADKTANPITLTMNQARSITAVVTPRMWTLNLSTSGRGTGTIKATPFGDNSDNALVWKYQEGQVVALEATADAGSVFTGWSGNLPAGQEKSNPLTVVMDRTRTITARFEQVVSVAVDVDGEGTAEVAPQLETYFRGASLTLTATPAEGWYFKEWTGSVQSNNDQVVVVLEGDLHTTAVFAEGEPPDDDEPGNPTPSEDTYTLASEVHGNGVITPAGGEFEAGSKLRLVATPAVGWVFVGWEGDAAGDDLATEIVLDQNRKIVARFEEDPNGGNGSGSPVPGAPPMCGAASAGMISTAMIGLACLSRSRRRWTFGPAHRGRRTD